MTIAGPNATFSLGRSGNDAAGADAPPVASIRLSNRARARLAFARIDALTAKAPSPQIHRRIGCDLFLNIRGPIDAPEVSEQGVRLQDVERALSENRRADRIFVRITSRGGSVNAAEGIRNALRDHGGYVTTIADEVCASAATIVLMAGDFRIASPGSHILLHQASLDPRTRWTADKHRRIAQKLDHANAALTAAYARATGKPIEEFKKEIANERPMPLSRARALNLIHCMEGQERWIAGRPHWHTTSPEEYISARFRDYDKQRAALSDPASRSALIGTVAFSKLAMRYAQIKVL
jgi:ATP-dependent protease ClpP protease subunit